MSKPNLLKTDGTLQGCIYTTTRNTALPDKYHFYLFNGTTKLSPVVGSGYNHTYLNGTVAFVTPKLPVDSDKWVGTFSCGIEIGSESVSSAVILIHEEAKGKQEFKNFTLIVF